MRKAETKRRPNLGNVGTHFATRELGAGLLVIGAAGVLEYAKVFGDGGSTLQLVLGLLLAALGLWILVRA